jgi:hypothetical protein
MTREYENKASIIRLHREDEETLTVEERDGNLNSRQGNFIHPDVKMIMMMTSKTFVSYIRILLETDASKIHLDLKLAGNETRSPAPSHGRQADNDDQ